MTHEEQLTGDPIQALQQAAWEATWRHGAHGSDAVEVRHEGTRKRRFFVDLRPQAPAPS